MRIRLYFVWSGLCYDFFFCYFMPTVLNKFISEKNPVKGERTMYESIPELTFSLLMQSIYIVCDHSKSLLNFPDLSKKTKKLK